MTTLKDLSRHLGLSVTQVSRAINGHDDVSEDTKLRVYEAAKKLNYKPNLSARRLATGRSGIVGLVLPRLPRYSEAAFKMTSVTQMSTQFARHGLHFMFHVSDEADNPVDIYRSLVESGSIDGFVILEPVIKDPRVAFLRKKGVPFVLHGRVKGELNYPYYDIDNEAVGYSLTKLLLDAGHTRIAFFNDEVQLTYARSRWDGHVRALAEVGLKPEPKFYRCGAMTEAFGLREGMRLLDRKNQRPTAFIAGNPPVAEGILKAAEVFDLRVPADISLVAHDDMLPDVNLMACEPPVSGTRVPIENSSAPLADFLAGALKGEPVETLQKIEVPEIVLRNSVARFQP